MKEIFELKPRLLLGIDDPPEGFDLDFLASSRAFLGIPIEREPRNTLLSIANDFDRMYFNSYVTRVGLMDEDPETRDPELLTLGVNHFTATDEFVNLVRPTSVDIAEDPRITSLRAEELEPGEFDSLEGVARTVDMKASGARGLRMAVTAMKQLHGGPYQEVVYDGGSVSSRLDTFGAVAGEKVPRPFIFEGNIPDYYGFLLGIIVFAEHSHKDFPVKFSHNYIHEEAQLDPLSGEGMEYPSYELISTQLNRLQASVVKARIQRIGDLLFTDQADTIVTASSPVTKRALHYLPHPDRFTDAVNSPNSMMVALVTPETSDEVQEHLEQVTGAFGA